ncbi:hypothetical protein E2C01_057002 [Portunus trituberculatus]|uniref:Uncharacterized protein n=1 Tax=Portunus trituberculatus TaxID=210409 RepID=A0A5B7GVM9_PORTR|nr:hypothetical protein [Portunus trituberculatus]
MYASMPDTITSVMRSAHRACGSVEVTGDQTFLEDYVSCVTIEGNLRIQLIEYNETQSLVGLPNLIQVHNRYKYLK